MVEEHEPLTPVDGTFIDVARATSKPPAWVVQDVIPEGLVILAGPPKASFKSTISMALSAVISGFDCKALPKEWAAKQAGPVMVFSHEADAGELRFILEVGLGVRLQPDESILVAARPEDFMLDEEDGRDSMLHWLNERKPILTIIDPLANFHNVEEKDAGEMIRIVAPLRRWAKENQAAIMVVHHTKKIDEDRAYRASDVRGSSALFGLCDSLLVLTPGQREYEISIDAQPKRGAAWQRTITLGAWGRRGQQGGEALGELDKMVLKAVKLGYKTVGDLSRHLSIPENTLTRRVSKLVSMSYLQQSKDKLKVIRDE